MNKIEDFKEGTVWETHLGVILNFHSIDHQGDPLFTCDEEHPYDVFNNNHPFPDGTIGFAYGNGGWNEFKKIK